MTEIKEISDIRNYTLNETFTGNHIDKLSKDSEETNNKLLTIVCRKSSLSTDDEIITAFDVKHGSVVSKYAFRIDENIQVTKGNDTNKYYITDTFENAILFIIHIKYISLIPTIPLTFDIIKEEVNKLIKNNELKIILYAKEKQSEQKQSEQKTSNDGYAKSSDGVVHPSFDAAYSSNDGYATGGGEKKTERYKDMYRQGKLKYITLDIIIHNR